MKKIVFFGNERLATGVTTDTPVLKALLENGYEVPAVVVAQSDATPSRKGRPLEIIEVAKAHNIQVLSPSKPADIIEQIKSLGADAAILVAYGKILPQSVIDIFPAGIINLHPSLLPKHRGPTPIESVILNGETETGISLMKLTSDMDSGPVYAQETVSLTGKEPKQELADQFGSRGAELMIQHVPAILDGSLSPTEQNNAEATYDKLLEKSDAQLDFHKPAQQLANEVRAFSGWPRSRTKLGTTEVIVTKASAAEASGKVGSVWRDSKQLGVFTADGVLIIDNLIPVGKQEMTGEAFLAGYQI